MLGAQWPERLGEFGAAAQILLSADQPIINLFDPRWPIRESAITHVVANISELPIDWQYVTSLTTLLRLDVIGHDRMQLLKKLLLFVPHVTLHENDFNAFVVGKTLVGDMPAICIYEHLSSAAYVFLEFLLANVVRSDHAGLRILNPDELRQIGESEPFCAKCVSVIALVLGIVNDSLVTEADLASTHTPGLLAPIYAATMGALMFVYYHEIGHLLLAHLQRELSPALEYEADAFAWTLVQTSPFVGGDQLTHWHKVGALTALSMIALVNACAGTDTTHPQGFARLQRAITALHGSDATLCAKIQEAFLIVCEGPVRVLGGLHYDITSSGANGC